MRRSIAVALVLAVSGLVVPSAFGDSKVLLRTIGPIGIGPGQVAGPAGVAVNRAGSGSANPGDVYIADAGNGRVAVYADDGLFKRAFGLGVIPGAASGTGTLTTGSATVTSFSVAGGSFLRGQTVTGTGVPAGTTVSAVDSTGVLTLSNPATASGVGVTLSGVAGSGNVPINEQQTVTLGSTTTGGSFTLQRISSASGARIAGQTTVTGVTVSSGAVAVGDVVTGGGIPANTTITAVAPGTLTLSAAATITRTGLFTVTASTSAIASNASGSAVQSALEALPAIGTGNVSVTSSAPLTWTVQFQGAYADTNVPALTAVATNLVVSSGTKTATIATKQEGAATPEICTSSCTTGASGGAPAAGSVSIPTGLAIDQTTGNVFVYSSDNRRVDTFSPAGVYYGSFGAGVISGGTALQFCTVTSGCLTATATGAAGGFGANTVSRNFTVTDSGHVVIPDPGNFRINEYVPNLDGSNAVTGATFTRSIGWDVIPSGGAGDTGTGLETCTTASTCKTGVAGGGAGQFLANSPRGLDVDSSGAIYALTGFNSSGPCTLTASCRVQKFNADGTFNSTFGSSSGPCQTTYPPLVGTGDALANQAIAVAVDPVDQHVYVFKKSGSATTGKLCEFGPDGTELSTTPAVGDLSVAVGLNPMIAMGTAGRVYVGNGNGQPIMILGPLPAPGAAISPTTAVAATSATVHGVVTVPSAATIPATTYRFEYSTDGDDWTSTSETAVGDGTAGDFPVSRTITGLDPRTKYLVRLAATTAPTVESGITTFTTSGQAPAVSQVRVTAQVDSATVTALIDPRNAPTGYHVDWGTSTAYGNRVPATGERKIGTGIGVVPIQETLDGLASATVYHFRLVATNATGTSESQDVQFATTDAAGVGDRVPELVSPADKGAGGYVGTILPVNQQFQVAPDGQTMLYPVVSGRPDATAGADIAYLGTRGSDGWQSQQLSPDQTQLSEPSGTEEISGHVQYLSPDASCTVVTSPEVLTPDAPPIVKDNNGGYIYRRDAGGNLELLTSDVPTNITDPAFQLANSQLLYNGITIVGSSTDCRHVYFKTPFRYAGLNDSGIYVTDNGTLRDAATLPDGTSPATIVGQAFGQEKAVTGAGTVGSSGNMWHAVASDGTKHYFTAISNAGADSGKPQVYLQQPGTQTIEVSASKTATPDTSGAYYQGAALDGSKVAFMANYGLTAQSSSGTTATTCTDNSRDNCALYVYDVASQSLTDISATNNASNSQGAVVEGLVGASDDLTAIYFAAGGQLVADQGSTYAQNVAHQTTNLYLSDSDGLHFVATVLEADLRGSGTGGGLLPRYNLTVGWLAQATPDGKSLLFQSRANIAGYDSGGPPEAYTYDRAFGVVCLSCRADGEPSVGGVGDSINDTRSLISFGLSSSPRSISDDGSRVFFASGDALAPGAVEGKKNIYVWDHGAVEFLATGVIGQGTSDTQPRFVGASTSGDDAFIKTIDALAPADTDGVYDVYDFRVGGGFGIPAATPGPCDVLADTCQGGLLASPFAPSIATATPTASEPGSSSARSSVRLGGLTNHQLRDVANGNWAEMRIRATQAGTLTVRATTTINGRNFIAVSAKRYLARPETVLVKLRLSAFLRSQLRRFGRLKIAVTAGLSTALESDTRTFTVRTAASSRPSHARYGARS